MHPTGDLLRVLHTPDELDELPIGSVIADITEPDSPAVACKAVRGWQFLNDDPDRRYEATAMLPAPKLKIVVLWRP